MIVVMYRAYALRPVGAAKLFNPGGMFDMNFAYGAVGFDTYASNLYHSWTGHFRNWYFEDFFKGRGLVGDCEGPKLPHFPYYEDVEPIHAGIKDFMRSFVYTYYGSDGSILDDPELQAWFDEANGPAKIYDFPPALVSERQTLIEVLTHMAYLTGILHHAVNSGSLAHSWTLPLHPTSHWQPLPTTKGIQSVMPYLANVKQSISQIIVENTFNRPQLAAAGATLSNMFHDAYFVAASAPGIVAATQKFTAEMKSFGAEIKEKAFDDRGLCQGMPFIYRDVNPLEVPFFLSI